MLALRSAARADRAALWLLTAALLVQGGFFPPAHAHGVGAGQIQAAWLKQSTAPPGIDIQVRHTLAPQVIVQNHGNRVLSILDATQRPFLRIHPDRVEGDLATAALYNTWSTAGLAVPEYARDPDAPARWATLAESPTWGWFDPRLDPYGQREPDDAASHRTPVVVGDWDIPARWGDTDITLTGAFEWQPVNPLVAQGELRSTQPAPAVYLRLIPGTVDALMVDNRSGKPVTLIGLDGEPWLRIGPDRVEANIASPSWRAWGRNSADAPPTDSTEPRWITVGGGHRWSWLEPRTRPITAPSEITTVDWTVPLVHDGKPLTVSGRTHWVDASEPM